MSKYHQEDSVLCQNLTVDLGLVLALFVLFGGFVTARGFRWKRQRLADEERLIRRDQDSRRHHFRGNLDVELIQSPKNDDPPMPV
jgi:hypothetical protein